MIRLLIADHHPLARNALARLLDSLEDMAVVAVAADGRAAVRLAGETRPDVIVMDVQLPKLDGISAIRELQRVGSPAAVVMLSAAADCQLMREALEAGTASFILKDAGPDAVLASVRAAAWPGGGALPRAHAPGILSG
jgi:DNA-binding NarL/FixJ family response regulator